jgi:hypothetical protein
VDLVAERQVSQEKIDEFQKQNPDMVYHETSALNGVNVEDMFISVATNHLSL